jgi:hypothetical protein
MVNLLEFLYAATVVVAVLALVAWLRSRKGDAAAPRRRVLARRLFLGAAGLAILCVGMYWYLSPW